MAAKPRVTVRLAPTHLHGLAYIAAIIGTTPAELARTALSQAVDDALRERGREKDCHAHYMAWLEEQAGRGERSETPDQRDYDRLAAGELAGPLDPDEARGQAEIDSLPARPLEGYVQHPLNVVQVRARMAADRAKQAGR